MTGGHIRGERAAAGLAAAVCVANARILTQRTTGWRADSTYASGGPSGVALSPGRVWLRPAGGAVLTLRRFADRLRWVQAIVGPPGWSVLRVPRDAASEPWHLGQASGAAVRLCLESAG